jgi:hypothetical protein
MRIALQRLAKSSLVTLILTMSCAKRNEMPTPVESLTYTNTVQELEQVFAQRYAQRLTEVLHTNAPTATAWTWKPKWLMASQQRIGDSATYTYVPLQPQLLSTGKSVLLVGAQRYIIIKSGRQKLSFGVISYTWDESTSASTSFTAPASFTDFSGQIQLVDLASKQQSYFRYQHGALQVDKSQTSAEHGTQLLRANACQTIYTCYWTGYCRTMDNQGMQPITWGKMTQGNGYCAAPSYETMYGCLEFSWRKTDQQTTLYCDYPVEPTNPQPGPQDPGPGPSQPGYPTTPTSPTNTLSIDKSQLTPCQDKVLTDLQNTSGAPLLNILQLFAGNTPGYNWKVSNGSLPPGVYGITAPYNSTTGSVNTAFDSGKWTNATDLSIARTMLHEEIHAYLLAYFKNDPIYANATFGTLVDAWAKAPVGADPNLYHHNEMAQGWVGDVAWALKQYGLNKGYTLSDQFYSDMAWAGLYETDLFKTKSTAEQTRIRNTIQTEINGTDFNGNPTIQVGAKAGC